MMIYVPLSLFEVLLFSSLRKRVRRLGLSMKSVQQTAYQQDINGDALGKMRNS